MLLIAASIGTEVNSAETSYEMMVSICLECDMFDVLYEIPCVLNMMGELPTKGFSILANSLAIS